MGADRVILSPYVVWLLCCWAQPSGAPIEALIVVNNYIERLDRGGMGAWEYHLGLPALDTLDLHPEQEGDSYDSENR